MDEVQLINVAHEWFGYENRNVYSGVHCLEGLRCEGPEAPTASLYQGGPHVCPLRLVVPSHRAAKGSIRFSEQMRHSPGFNSSRSGQVDQPPS